MANNEPISFNIDQDDYKTFIESLREELSQSTSHGIPVLMPQSEGLSWMDVRLIAGDRSITLRIERRNLYVRGYIRDGDSHFWEFNDSHMIPESQSLRYSGSYARVDRESLSLGFQQLQHAIHTLARTEDPNSNGEESAKQLLTIIQMIPEATRIELIAAHVANNWFESQPMTPRMILAQNAWGTFSSAVQRSDYTGLSSTPLPPDVPNPNPMGISTLGQAAAVFGILLCHEIKRRVKRDVTQSSSAVTLASHVRTLVSIEFVRVNIIDGVELYGTVTVNDCWGSHTVYERSSGEAESKRPGDCASLTGPSTAISGEDAFTISVSLWDHYRLLPDHEIAKGDIVWDPRKDSSYDTTLLADVGSVTVGYSVIREALSATVSVKIIGRDAANVYGTIKASSKLQSSTTLFDKSKKEYVQVRPQAPIPLAREVVPAPVNFLSTIAVDLWDNATFSDYQIAEGCVQFTPKVGTQERDISAGTYGEVNVSITCG